ncbi:MAG: glycosyltransferase [Pseudomonadota bacterium]
MKLSFIVVAHNVKQYVGGCLSSIQNALGDIRSSVSEAELIVVDRASTDGTAVEARAAGADAVVDVPFNAGWAVAANKGVEKASGDLLVFVAPETVLQPGGLPRLLAYLDTNPSCAVAGGAVVSTSGAMLKGAQRLPGFVSTVTGASGLAAAFPKTVLNWAQYGACNLQSATVVEAVSFAYAAIKADTLKAFGGFDARFFDDFAGADLCYQISRSMPRPTIAFVPQARAQVQGESALACECSMVALGHKEVVRHRVRGEALYMWKNGGMIFSIVNAASAIACQCFRYVYNVVPGIRCNKVRAHSGVVLGETCKACLDTQLGSQYPATPW